MNKKLFPNFIVVVIDLRVSDNCNSYIIYFLINKIEILKIYCTNDTWTQNILKKIYIFKYKIVAIFLRHKPPFSSKLPKNTVFIFIFYENIKIFP